MLVNMIMVGDQERKNLVKFFYSFDQIIDKLLIY